MLTTKVIPKLKQLSSQTHINLKSNKTIIIELYSNVNFLGILLKLENLLITHRQNISTKHILTYPC